MYKYFVINAYLLIQMAIKFSSPNGSKITFPLHSYHKWKKIPEMEPWCLVC